MRGLRTAAGPLGPGRSLPSVDGHNRQVPYWANGLPLHWIVMEGTRAVQR